jgi:Transposase, Mutator family/CRISPR-associated protein (Cas_Cas5)
LRPPHWPLALGRKAFVPAQPVWLDDAPFHGLHPGTLTNALSEQPRIAPTRREHRDQPTRVLLEHKHEGALRHDQPTGLFVGKRLRPGSSPTVAAAWRRAWDKVIPSFAFPPEVRKVIYTTNAIESVNARLRKIIKTRGHFPSDDAATKLIWLALRIITADWGRPANTWTMTMNQFAILYEERFTQPTAAPDEGGVEP